MAVKYDLLEVLTKNIIPITTQTFEIILKLNNPADCLALYMFYIHKSIKEKEQGYTADAVKADNVYCAKGLDMSEKRVSNARKQLKDVGLIEQVIRKDKSTNKIIGHYVRVNYVINITSKLKEIIKKDENNVTDESEEVVNEEVINKEIVNEEIDNKEVINKEIVNEEIDNKEVINKEINNNLDDIARYFEKPKDKFLDINKSEELRNEILKVKTKKDAEKSRENYRFVMKNIELYKSLYLKKYEREHPDVDIKILYSCMNKIVKKIRDLIEKANDDNSLNIENVTKGLLADMFWKASGKNGVFPLNKQRATIQKFSKYIDDIIANTI
jgi:hypothetical protein